MATKRLLTIVPDSPRAAPAARDAVSIERTAILPESPELHALLVRGLRAIVALTGARGGAVRLRGADDHTLRLAASFGLPEGWVRMEQSVEADCGMCGAALKSNCTQLDAEAAQCGSRLGAFAGPTIHGPALAVPLHCQGRPVGVFNLFFEDQDHAPGNLSSLVTPVAEMLDLVLDNAMLQQERVRASAIAERHHMAAEVHDSLAQSLAFMRMSMSLLHDAMRSNDRKRAVRYFEDVNESLCEAHGRLRSLISQSREGMDQGLIATLRSTAQGFQDRTGVALRVESKVDDLRLPPEHEAQVLHIVQEALSNVIKHAGASQVRVVINRSTRRLQISVEDDGVGTEAVQPAAGHYGLEIMRERAERIGGNLEIRSAPRKGTRVRLVIPATAPAPAP